MSSCSSLVDELLQTLDDFFLALHIGRREQLVFVQRVEQLVVFGRALFLDIAEARVPDAVVGHLDALGPRSRISIKSSEVAPIAASGKETTTSADRWI